MIDITPIINIIIAVLGTVLTSFLLPLIKSKLDAHQRQELAYWINIAVSAAEQLMGSGVGKEKKAYVMNFLAHKGYTVDEQVVEAMLEASVLSLPKKIAK
ncbi:MAG: phage holin, LLH family [Oscillospiraceae bacterium]